MAKLRSKVFPEFCFIQQDTLCPLPTLVTPESTPPPPCHQPTSVTLSPSGAPPPRSPIRQPHVTYPKNFWEQELPTLVTAEPTPPPPCHQTTPVPSSTFRASPPISPIRQPNVTYPKNFWEHLARLPRYPPQIPHEKPLAGPRMGTGSWNPNPQTPADHPS